MKKSLEVENLDFKNVSVAKKKSTRQLLKSANPQMMVVLEKLEAGKTDGISEVLSKVRWVSRLQAKSFASFFGHSELDAISTQYVFTIKRRKTGRPLNESTPPELASYERGRLVSQTLERLDAEMKAAGQSHKHITAKIAVNTVVDTWTQKQTAKPPTYTSLSKDYSYFCRVKKLKAGSLFFPPWPKLVKDKKRSELSSLLPVELLHFGRFLV
jgi:hypothetical protein